MPAAKKPKSAAAKRTNIYAVVGNDEGRVKDTAAKLAAEVAPPDAGDFGIEVVSGVADNSAHAARICADTVQALFTLPLFGGAKLVWLKNVNFAADDVTGRAESTLAALEHLAGIIEAGLPPDVTFLVSATDIDKRRSFYKALTRAADTRVCDKPDSRGGWEEGAASYVGALARERGLTFRRDALDLFVSVAGDNSSALLNELEKLDVYLGTKRTAEVADVEAVVSLGRGGAVFEIGDAIGKRDLRRAIERVDHFLHLGESAIGILLAAIVPKIRNLFYAKYFAVEHGVRAGSYQAYQAAVAGLPAEATAFLPRSKKDDQPSVYPVFLAAGEVRRFSFAHLRASLEACLEANRRLVTTQLDPRLVLHQLLARVLVEV
jgi:DNA polymerase-3 subunit delta